MKEYELLMSDIKQLIKDTESEIQYRSVLSKDDTCWNKDFVKGQEDFAKRYKYRLQEIILKQLERGRN